MQYLILSYQMRTKKKYSTKPQAVNTFFPARFESGIEHSNLVPATPFSSITGPYRIFMFMIFFI